MDILHTAKVSRLGARRRQGGAATLIVVMLLFFVMSLTAAYASRNLIFEQRTSTNQYRSTQVFEASQAGIEWALAMINSGRIGDDCLPTNDVSRNNFRQRYLVTNATSGVVTRRLHASGVPDANLWAACSFDGSSWRCRCPTGSLNAGDLPAGTAAFAVRFVDVNTTKPGVIRIEANGCGSYAQTAEDLACLQFVESAGPALCKSTSCAMLALYSGAKAPPSAALTVRDALGGTSLAVYNTDIDAGGVTVHAGSATAIAPSITLAGLPGTPPDLTTRLGDDRLSGLDAEDGQCTYCMFSAVFGVRPVTFARQMGAVQLDCSVTCDAAAVNAALGTARSRVVVLSGNGGLTLNDPADIIGSNADPVVLAIEGPLTINVAATSAARVTGLVYAGSAVLNSGEVHGALVSASTVTANGNTKIVYDRAALTRVRLTSGTYVRIPGSWRDHR